MRLIFCLLIAFTASNNHALELKDGSFYHECTYSSPKSASGYKPNPKIRYTIGFMNKSFKMFQRGSYDDNPSNLKTILM